MFGAIHAAGRRQRSRKRLITNGPLLNTAFTNYTFDARNRLLTAGGVTNSYDARNNRTGQTYGTNTTTYVLNPNAKLPQVVMRIKNGVTNYYIYGAGLLYQITETAAGTNTLTYHYDYRGSTIALSADSGLVTDRIEYALYGLTTYRTGTNDTPFLFNGRYGVQTDPNGLLYMRSRYYNPYLCRFINPDPSGFKGGLNFYAYANGNPVSYLDPFGLNAAATGDSDGSWFYNQLISPASAGSQEDTFDKANDFAQSIIDAPNQIAQANGIPPLAMAGIMTILLPPEVAGLTADLAGADAAETTANTPLALGLTDAGLEQFAQARGATIATGENWQTTVLDALNDPNTTVHFNLDQVDVWQGVQRAASGQGGPTDWELLQIQQNPQSWDTLQFWKGGQPAPNPFK